MRSPRSVLADTEARVARRSKPATRVAVVAARTVPAQAATDLIANVPATLAELLSERPELADGLVE
jgi:hypothetical protein